MQLVSLERRDREAGGTDGVERRPVAVAAVGHDSVEAIESVLPGGEPGLLRPYVLDEE